MRTLFFRYLFLLLIGTIITFLTGCVQTLPQAGKILPGTYQSTVEMTFRGFKRDFLVHVPTNFTPQKTYPLVVVVHGAFSSASAFSEISGFNELADREGFIVSYANGVGIFGFLRHWNAGFCCAYAAENKIDDTGYLKQIIESSSKSLPINRERIFLVGFSNGGMLVHRFATEYPEYPKSVAVVSATIGAIDVNIKPEWKLKPPPNPVSVFLAHGTADDSIPYEGGAREGSNGELTFYSFKQSVEFWLNTNQCSQTSDTRYTRENAVEKKSWEDCSKNKKVVKVSLANWNHRWPGVYHTSRLSQDDSLFNYNLTKEIWEFFKAHP